MTYRQIIAALAVGQSHTFADVEQAKVAAAAGATKLHSRRFTRSGATITRVE